MIARAFALALLLARQGFAQAPEEEEPIFVIGYGSLMKETSRIRSTCRVDLSSNQIASLSELLAEDAFDDDKKECMDSVRSSNMILVEVAGIRRGWYHASKPVAASEGNVAPVGWALQALDIGPTYLGAVQDDTATVYAVAYKVTKNAFEQTDKREKTYDHVWADPAKVKRLDSGAFPENAKFRWYADPLESITIPTKQAPMCQSYVDVWLTGALELEEVHGVTDYVKNVMESTYGWNGNWVNDRPAPYRPFVYEPDSGKVASALLAVARAHPNTVIENKKEQPLTMDILNSIRFPGQALPWPEVGSPGQNSVDKESEKEAVVAVETAAKAEKDALEKDYEAQEALEKGKADNEDAVAIKAKTEAVEDAKKEVDMAKKDEGQAIDAANMLAKEKVQAAERKMEAASQEVAEMEASQQQVGVQVEATELAAFGTMKAANVAASPMAVATVSALLGLTAALAVVASRRSRSGQHDHGAALSLVQDLDEGIAHERCRE